ncbi:hypothetical protein SAMD00019534_120900 [Acytostelium subglobosum LB1]|uniref:hypothetical protein n=1 Tax=Acytostelium subglobosum LB1 TaxID=1410327 RepID=UPI0006449B6D|nr:hypothetical protein SAMD00019534_120900 [Acytostelium subglobosum LB1]GAM28914.1 hypothetical protein SAMD00019534_120900 [Acytostelium subglobosum LB1]|eukprot:XP_012748099.1 hypothetical protein SAMD00019534_120900 [Acytostelium subglobosum LB1]
MDATDINVENEYGQTTGEVRHQVNTRDGQSLTCFFRKAENAHSNNLPFVITYHDVGINHITCFNPFFEHPKMKTALPFMNIIHIEAPGHQYKAETIPEDDYPTFTQLAKDILYVLEYFKVKNFIGFGVGVGGAVLTQFAILQPKYVVGLILVGSELKGFGWMETMKHWVGWKTMPSTKNPQSVFNYLLDHYHSDNPNIMETIKVEVSNINMENMCHYIDSYLKREDIKMSDIRALRAKVLVIVGKDATDAEDIVELFSHFNPSSATLLQVPDCGLLVTAENPTFMIEPFKLYMQGCGYMLDYYLSVGDDDPQE